MNKISVNGPSGDMRVLEDLMRAASVNKSELKFSVSELSRTTILSVECSSRDYAQLIGTGGKNVREWSVVGNLIGQRSGRHVEISIATPKSKERPKPADFRANPKWGKEQISPFVKSLCSIIFDRGTVTVIDVNDSNTAIEVSINEDEPLEMPIEKIEVALRRIFQCIGKVNGKNIVLDLVQFRIPKAIGRGA